jgi:hypothetical protein
MPASARSCLLVILLLAFARPARAQPADSIGVRALGMGGAFTAVADDATATWWNPAGLASGAMLNVSLEYGRLEQPDNGRGAFAVTFPALGLSYYRMPVSEIQPTSSTADSPAGRQDPGNASVRTVELSQFGATVGQSIGSHFVLASTIKILHMDDATELALDIGALAVVGHARFGVLARNLREPTLGDGANALTLSRQVRAGAAVSAAGNPKVGATLAFDADILEVPTVTGNERRMAVGGELWMWNHVVGARAGFGGSTVGDARTSGSLGGSVMLHRGVYFDGELTRGSDMTRRGWLSSLRLTF